MRAVHFGAGNIGRGFIGLLLSDSGYDLTFVEANPLTVKLINDLGAYPVYIVSKDNCDERWVRNVRSINAFDIEAAASAIAQADIVTTAVGKAALPLIAPAIAEGLMRRRKENLTVMVVACENVLGNSSYLEKLVNAVSDIDALAGKAVFPNCVVDRIVPNVEKQKYKHPLAVTVEDYAQWVIDAEKVHTKPSIVGAEFQVGLDAVLGQKLLTLNTAHAIVGYYGYLHGSRFVHEAMQYEPLRALLDGALREASCAVNVLYNIDPAVQSRYVQRIITRLENPALQDQIIRVSRDPIRKLGANDRLIKPALIAAQAGHVPTYLATGVAAALLYNAKGDGEAEELSRRIRTDGLKLALAKVSGVPENHVLAELVHASVNFHAL